MRYAESNRVAGEKGAVERRCLSEVPCVCPLARPSPPPASPIAPSLSLTSAPSNITSPPPQGIVLVSPCYTDLGLLSERRAGWYNRPWNWTAIRENSGFIMQFSSKNDGLVPYREQAYVADKLGSELTNLMKGHFLISKFPELADKLEAKLAPGTSRRRRR